MGEASLSEEVVGMAVGMKEGELLMEEEVQGDGKCELDRAGRGVAEQRKIFCIVNECTHDERRTI